MTSDSIPDESRVLEVCDPPYADVREHVVVGRVLAVDSCEGTLLSGALAIGGFEVPVNDMA